MFINSIKNASKRVTALILTMIIVFSVFVSLPLTAFVSALHTDVNYIEVKSGAAWTSVVYVSDVTLVNKGYYKFSFDYKQISGEPTFQISGYDTAAGEYKNISEFCYSTEGLNGAVTDTVENGITRCVVTLRLNKKVERIRIIIGAYKEATDISCIFANPELYRYTSMSFDTLYSGAANLLKDLSEDNIYDVMTEDPTYKANKYDKWNLRYLTGNRNKIVYGTLTADEHKAKFAPPTYMIRLYEGNQNTIAEYVDNNIHLTAGKYTFNCDWKELKGISDFSIAVSNDNGLTFNNVETNITDSENSQRKVEFELQENANAIKITLGNPTDKSNVSLAFASPVLVKNGEETNLIESINSSTANFIGLNDSNTDKKWNIKRDSDNESAVDTPVIPEGYFTDEAESLMYETNVGFNWTRMHYDEAAVEFKAGKTYIVSADFKLKAGTMENDQIGISDDPMFLVKVDTAGISGQGSISLNKNNEDKFNGLIAEFSEAEGKITIKFSPKADMKGVAFIIGNYCETRNGACAVANPSIIEYTIKANGVTVLKDNLIKNITEETSHYPDEGKSANNEIGKWNTVALNNNKNSFKLSAYDADYFEPELAYIKTMTGAENNRVEYLDNTTVFKAGVKYRLKLNYRVFSGEPQAFLSFKKIGGVEGKYVKLDADTSFIKNFNDQIDEVTFTRTITFVPLKNISMMKFVVGNLSDATNISVSVANAELFEVDANDINVGENILAKIIRPTIKRNSPQEKIWNLCSAKDKDIIFTVPVPSDAYIASKMVRIKAGYEYNRVEYFDESVKIEPNTSYRFSVDYKALGGTASFSVRDIKKNDIKKYSSQFKTHYDESTAIRYIEFTTKPDIEPLKGVSIIIGNGGEAKDVSCIFANPQLVKIVDGEAVGDNLIKNITEKTVQYMGTMAYNGIWNLRYQGKKDVALVLEDIPKNYFRVPTLATDGANGSVTQFVTAEPEKSYALSFNYKNEGGSECVPYVEGILANGSSTLITVSEITKDTNGYYNYKCEFKMPKNLRADNNLRVGVKLDGMKAAFSNFELYELDAGFETTGVNLLKNSDFLKSNKLSDYNGVAVNDWIYEGSQKNVAITSRGSDYFKIPVPQLYMFAGGSVNNYIGHELELEADGQYTLSFNLRYANPGYDGDTGVELLYNNGTEWVTLNARFTDSATEYKQTYKFTMPSDAVADSVNMQFKVKADSFYVSGYIANAKLYKDGTSENLIENGDFSKGTNGWKIANSFKMSSLNVIPENYFSKNHTTKNMIVYRNSGAWENIQQNYLALKSDTYYLLEAEAVHPWQSDEDDKTSVHTMQVFAMKDGKDYSPFLGSKREFSTEKNKVIRLYKTPDDLDTGTNNTIYRMVMQGLGNAGYWGSFALYECDENGNKLSDNVLINSDFALGATGWTFSQRNEDFNYRIVKQPENFFSTYTKNDANMIESKGTSADALLGQTMTVERGTKYYFTGHYVSMNSAGITPKIVYKDKNGKEQEYMLNSYYDSERFFFEIEFELPSDAYAYRGVADVKFHLTNSNKGKAYISDLALYKEGEYINLLNNSDFANGFTNWYSNDNYKIVPFDSGVFVFHYDDEEFNDGNWSNENGTAGVLGKGQISGYVVDESGDGIKNVEMVLEPLKLTVKTDAMGKYTFNNLDAGIYSVYLKDKSGKLHYITDVTVSNGISSDISSITLSAEKQNDSDEEDYTVDGDFEVVQNDTNFGIVCGYLFDADGSPVKNVKLYLGKVTEVVTKNRGVFQFDKTRPGKYDIYTKNEDGTINVLKTVEVVAGKGSMYKLYLPSDSSNLWLIIVLIAFGVVVLAGAGVTVWLIIKKKKAKK